VSETPGNTTQPSLNCAMFSLLLGAPCVTQIHEDHGRVRTLYAQYQSPVNTMQQRQLLALDIIRHSSMHSKKEDMVRCSPDGVVQMCTCRRGQSRRTWYCCVDCT
jgi:hypothetical protein